MCTTEHIYILSSIFVTGLKKMTKPRNACVSMLSCQVAHDMDTEEEDRGHFSSVLSDFG